MKKGKMPYLIPLGMLLIFAGMIFVVIGSMIGANSGSKDSNVKIAVGGFFGFIPFGFANDKRMMWVVVGLMVVAVLVYILMARKYFG